MAPFLGSFSTRTPWQPCFLTLLRALFASLNTMIQAPQPTYWPLLLPRSSTLSPHCCATNSCLCVRGFLAPPTCHVFTAPWSTPCQLQSPREPPYTLRGMLVDIRKNSGKGQGRAGPLRCNLPRKVSLFTQRKDVCLSTFYLERQKQHTISIQNRSKI